MTLWSSELLRTLTEIKTQTLSTVLTFRTALGFTIGYFLPVFSGRDPVAIPTMHIRYGTTVRERVTFTAGYRAALGTAGPAGIHRERGIV